jgi:hypothetical protein
MTHANSPKWFVLYHHPLHCTITQVIPAKQVLSFSNIDFANDADSTTGCDISTVVGRPVCYLPHGMYDNDDGYKWNPIRATVNEQLGSSILAQSARTHLDRFNFMIYGMFHHKVSCHQYLCQCRDEVKHKHDLLNKVKHSILRSRGGYRISYDVKYGPLDEAPTCMACGEK